MTDISNSKTNPSQIVEKDEVADEGEKSLLPIILLIFNLVLSVISGFVYFYSTETEALLDSFWPMVFKTTAIFSVVYFVPLLFAAFTPFQRKRRKTTQVIVVLGGWAITVAFIFFIGFYPMFNKLFDRSEPVFGLATIEHLEYRTGKPGQFAATVAPEGFNKSFVIVVSKEDFLKLKQVHQVKIAIYKGYFNKRRMLLANSQ